MTRGARAEDPEAQRLREAIAAELIALRGALSFRTRTPGSPGDIADQVSGVLRSNPAWAAGAAAGALAGVVAGLRGRFRRRDEE